MSDIHWVRCTLGELAVSIDYGYTASAVDTPDGPRFLRITDIQNGAVDWKQVPGCQVDERTATKYQLASGDLVFARTGATTGKSFLIDEPPDAIFASYLIRLRLTEALSSKFVSYYFQSAEYWREISQKKTGSAQPGVNATLLRSLDVPVAPEKEQLRIVDSLDSYLSRLDAAMSGLKRVQANLKRYRASVLKAAVEGKVVPTEAELAKAEGRTFEPASELLARILKERRTRWEAAEFASMKAKGKPPKDDKWKAKYKEPTAPDTKGLPELPEGWCWATVEQLGDVTGGVTKNAKRDGLPLKRKYLRVANVYANELRLDEVLDIGVTEAELPRITLKKGDLLVVEGNGSLDQIGRVALWDGSVADCVHQNHLIKVRFEQEDLGRWALAWLLSPRGRSEIAKVASSTAGLHTLSISKIAQLLIPIAPQAEQHRASTHIDQLLSIATQNELLNSVSITRCARLRQSILKWAFEGKLVDQDPNDEPATALLVRIRAEREAPRRLPPTSTEKSQEQLVASVSRKPRPRGKVSAA